MGNKKFGFLLRIKWLSIINIMTLHKEAYLFIEKPNSSISITKTLPFTTKKNAMLEINDASVNKPVKKYG